MPEVIICNITADVRQKSTSETSRTRPVREAKFRGSGRRQILLGFLNKVLIKFDDFGLRQARGRFGRFSDRPDRARRDEPLRPTEEGVQDKTIEHDNEMTTTTTMIVLKTKVRVDDDDDEVDHDEDDDDDQSQKRIRVDGGDDEVDHNEEEEEDDTDDRTRKQFVSSATTIQVDHGDDDYCDVTIPNTTSKTRSAPQPQREREFLIRPLDT